jgi:adenosylcobinamide-GDP ribazoletransferase
MWAAFVSAVRFLTIIPIPDKWVSEPVATHQQSFSLLFYPLVGFLIGLCLLCGYFLTGLFSDTLQAIILVTLWVVTTGALHLDGVADSADAWLGGHGDRERTLQILRDTAVGVAGVVAIVLTLLLKVAALSELKLLKLQAVVLVPVIGRTAVMLLFTTTRYVRAEGIGKSLTEALPRKTIIPVLIAVPIILVAVLHIYAFVMLFCVLCGFLGLRYLMMRRLGGTTGDTAGAMIEFSEILALLGLVLAERLL